MNRDHSVPRSITVALAAALMLGPAIPAAAFPSGSSCNPSDSATAGGAGSGAGGNTGNITINGGTINAAGGNTGAGIGGGGNSGTGITIPAPDGIAGDGGPGAGIGTSGEAMTQQPATGVEPQAPADPPEGRDAATPQLQAAEADRDGRQAAPAAEDQGVEVQQATPPVWAATTGSAAPTATASGLAPVRWGEVPEDLWMYLMVAKGWRGIPGDGMIAIYPPGTPGVAEARDLPESVFVHTVTPEEVPAHVWDYLLREGWRDVAGDGAEMIYPPEFFG